MVAFLGLIGMALILGCVYALIRKLFGKKRHGEKNKQKGGGGFGGIKSFFGGKGGGGSSEAIGQIPGIGGNKVG